MNCSTHLHHASAGRVSNITCAVVGILNLEVDVTIFRTHALHVLASTDMLRTLNQLTSWKSIT